MKSILAIKKREITKLERMKKVTNHNTKMNTREERIKRMKNKKSKFKYNWRTQRLTASLLSVNSWEMK